MSVKQLLSSWDFFHIPNSGEKSLDIFLSSDCRGAKSVRSGVDEHLWTAIFPINEQSYLNWWSIYFRVHLEKDRLDIDFARPLL